MSEHLKVPEDEFYKQIYDLKLNVHPHSMGNYPYTTEFRFPSGQVWGKIMPSGDCYILKRGEK